MALNDKVTIPLVVDVGMIIALVTLTFWIGREAEKVDSVITIQGIMQRQLDEVRHSSTSVELAAERAHNDAQDKEMAAMKVDLVARLVRIENKLDNKR